MTDKTEKTQVGNTGVELTDKEIADAQKEGALEYVREGGKRAMAADTGTSNINDKTAEQQRLRVDPSLNTTFIAELLDLGEDELKRRLKGDDPAPVAAPTDAISFEVAKGLLALERAGKNRTGYVKLLCDAIGKTVGRKVSPIEVTSAGPAFTNDETAVTAL